MVMTRPPALQIWNFLMKNRKSLNSGLNELSCTDHGTVLQTCMPSLFLVRDHKEILHLLQRTCCFLQICRAASFDEFVLSLFFPGLY